MPELTITVQVPWPKHPTLAALEKAIFKALMAAGRQLLVAAFAILEANLLAEGAGARQRRRRRYLLTRFGEVRFVRWQTRTPKAYRCPLDAALGLGPHDACSPWVQATAAWLVQAHPYRQAAAILSRMIGCFVDHRRVWGWAQSSGRKLREHWEEKRAAVFDQGELPPAKPHPPRLVSTSVDGTYIKSRDGPAMEVKLGVWWTGSRLESPTAIHPRHLLTGKGYFATTDDADRFGQTFYVLAEDQVGISRAKDVFLVADGAGWTGELFPEWLAPTAFQLDHFHGKLRIKEVAKDPEVAARWWGWVAEQSLDALGRSLTYYINAGRVDPEAGRNLLHYFQKGAGALHTYLRLRQQGHSPQMAPRGSGAIEHNIDLVVARRFKRQGMRWSREGANNLLALRGLARDQKSWRTWWGGAAM